jgi:cob(I)alamin adenosyltransferase
MGYRLSKIYTRTGDQGSTGLGDGQRVHKDSPRIEAIGTVDELNCLLGVLLAQGVPAPIGELLTRIQHHLFDLGGELAMPAHLAMTADKTELLEQQLDQLNEALPPLKEFILPAGNLPCAHCHHARSVCRRAERRLLHLARQKDEEINPECLKYLNRLSDLLFVMARVLARQNGGEEIYWKHDLG